MAQPSSISCSVTEDQLTQIDTLVARTGQTRSEWLQELVDAALSREESLADSGFKETLHLANPMIPKVSSNQGHLSSGTAPYPTVDPLEEDEPDEVLYDFLESDSASHRKTEHSLPAYAPDNIYEAEDEPDEVLYDFLDEGDRPV
ncbi:MAG: hypothetical protein AB4042_01075 [Leptolyngbyaceae cyanobacterium]